MTTYNRTRYLGVRFKDVSTRTHKGKPDRYFLIRYGREGRTVNEGVGFSSEGVDAKYASTVRSEIVKNIRLGTGCQSLADKRELESKRQADELALKENQKHQNICSSSILEVLTSLWHPLLGLSAVFKCIFFY